MFSQIRALYPLPARINSGGVNSAVADQSLTVSTASVPATGYTEASAGGGAVLLVTFDVQTSNVRCRWDGTAPTSTTGHLLYAGQGYTWPTGQYNAARFIRDTAASVDATIFASAMNA